MTRSLDGGGTLAVPPPTPRWRRQRGRHAWLAVLVLLATAAACGDDTSAETTDDEPAADEPTDTGSEVASDDADDVALKIDGATAARGAGLDAPPGPEERAPFPDFDEVAISVTDPGGAVRGACVLLAMTGDQRRQGLMEVTDLGGYAGMLFVAELEAPQSFWMRNTPMPLSIAWFDDDGAYVSEADMEPFDETSHSSGGPARFALEVPRGELPDLGIEAGSTLRVGGRCA